MNTENSIPARDQERRPASNSQRIIGITLLIAIAVVIAWLVHQRSTHVYTDDARVATDMVVISSKVAGRVRNLAVKEGSPVQAGDLIAQLDFREAQLRLEELEAELKSTEASIAGGEAELAMVERQTAGALQAAESGLAATRASLASVESDHELKRSEWRRAKSLLESRIISQQDWEQARSAFQIAEQNQNRAKAQVASAEARLVEATAARDRRSVLKKHQERLRHDRERVAVQLARQQVYLDDLRILSPLDGIVDQTFVNTGEYLVPGQRIALVHAPDNIWVRANIKETEVRHLSVGQRVKISVDAYPDQVFYGEIERIGQAATSQFALFPSTNPSGNFTKVTQRLPVKITVRQDKGKLKPGMMVGIAVEIQ